VFILSEILKVVNHYVCFLKAVKEFTIEKATAGGENEAAFPNDDLSLVRGI
jgi:hypothetical protein